MADVGYERYVISLADCLDFQETPGLEWKRRFVTHVNIQQRKGSHLAWICYCVLALISACLLRPSAAYASRASLRICCSVSDLFASISFCAAQTNFVSAVSKMSAEGTFTRLV